MSAIYWVTFDNGRLESVSSADAKSSKPRDVRASYVKARKKAEVKHRRQFPAAKVVSVRCVG